LYSLSRRIIRVGNSTYGIEHGDITNYNVDDRSAITTK
jgi:hypothetical protein